MEITHEGIKLGFLFLHFYGIIIMSGVILASFLAYRGAKLRGLNPELVWDLLIWLIIAGVIGARVWHILTPAQSAVEGGLTTQYYLTHPLDAIAVWKGGLGIVGAVIGGALALFLYTRKHGLDFLEWADIAAPSLALGQAIGRFGNFFNQELYGAPTDLPWKLYIDPSHRHPAFASVEYYHPLFAYEALFNLLNLFLLMWATRKYEGRSKKGDILLIYLIFYPVVRFSLEFLRLDPAMVGSININQAFMAVIAVSAAVTLVWRHRTRPVPTDKTDSF